MAISKTELLPTDWENRSVVPRLNQTLEVAKALYASVAFWTISPGYLSARLEQLLAMPPSFCCVDLRGGTNLNRLLAFHDARASELFLFLRKVTQSSELALNRHLLHTKLLLFDLPDGQAELWVGSHNFTAYALGGGNREASLVLTVSQDVELYRQAKTYLLALKKECIRFDRAQLDQYKQLQGTDDDPELECYVLPLFWDSQRHQRGLHTLADQTALLLTRDAETGARLIRHFGHDKPLLVWAYDLATGEPTYWNAEVQNAARITTRTNSSSDLRFGHPLLITVQDQQLPQLRPKTQELDQALLREFSHSASLRLYANVTERYQLLPPPDPEAKARWVPDPHATAELNALTEEATRLHAALRAGADQPLLRNSRAPNPEVAAWETKLVQSAPRARRLPPVARQPIVLKPVFQAAKLPEVHDPLNALTQRLSSAASRQGLRQQLGQALRADTFTAKPAQTSLLFFDYEAAAITLEKVLLKYHLVLR
jgi:HKD family nuclease